MKGEKTMNKPNVTKLLNTAKHVTKKHSPEVLTGIGIAGMASTVLLAVKATPKAMELIQEEIKRISEATVEEAREWSENGGVPMKQIEVVKAAWKPYIPAAVTGVASIACLIGANSVHVRRNAALATAYQRIYYRTR